VVKNAHKDSPHCAMFTSLLTLTASYVQISISLPSQMLLICVFHWCDRPSFPPMQRKQNYSYVQPCCLSHLWNVFGFTSLKCFSSYIYVLYYVIPCSSSDCYILVPYTSFVCNTVVLQIYTIIVILSLFYFVTCLDLFVLMGCDIGLNSLTLLTVWKKLYTI
jgi:hypothetical protein